MVSLLPRDSRVPLKRRADYRPPAFVVDEVAMEVDLDADATRVSATLRFRRNPGAVPGDRGKPLVLDGEQQTDVSAELDGVALAAPRAELAPGRLTIHEPPSAGTLTVRSTIAPSRNVALEGLYLSSDVLCTQCEPEGFRRITFFPDRPDVLARYTVTIRGDRERFPVMLSNGNLIREGDLPAGRHFATWHDPFPKPSYLFALVAGDLAALEDRFTTLGGREVALAIYSTQKNLARCHHAMASLKAAMRWDEQRYGREYDLDRFMIFCADDFNMGAMENKGLNIFNSRLVLADAATATDEDYQAIEGVIGHEYFHNWSGNRVTCRDWFQLSLKEGLTVFRDQEFSSDRGSRAVERIAAVEYLRRDQFAEDAGPMAHPVRPDEYQEINNFYTATVYEKGAELIRMQHTLLGPEAFRRGLDLYFSRHDGQAVTCDDFLRAMADASGADLGQFARWYAQAGTPVLRVSRRHDEAAGEYVLDVEQATAPSPGQPAKQPFHVPLAVGLVGPDGRDLPLRLAGEAQPGGTTRVLEVREARQRFRFLDVDRPVVPSLLRGFSAPVQLEVDYSDRELAFLAAYDSDPVNRWDAAQRTFVGAMLWLARERRAGRAMALTPAVEHVVAHLVEDEDSDPALLALALTPPDPAYVASMEIVQDPDGIVAARSFLTRELALRLRVPFEALVARHKPRARYAPTQAQIGPRKLRNVALRYLGALDDAGSRALAVAQYDAADNMTDTVAALAAIRDSDAAERHELYARFEARWRDEPLVLDKWFSLEATAQREGTVARVAGLLAHPRFSARNPNRVRALVGAFAHRNFGGFHAADGSGYAFVADQVLALDALNPQVASSIAGAFNLWKRFPEPRRARMQAALERIARQPGLSNDVGEIVGRTLDD
ncbi:MAG: aminopeptidase N [Betaproteobacteria bacterium]|nr:MAG: aminopeptidase N [Betaproteobacteria bacterium]